MRFLANENVPAAVVAALRQRAHDVMSVKDGMRGASDREILTRAQAEGRIVVTCDRDFGELAFRFGLPAACGVVLLRLSGSSPLADNTRALAALESRTDWAGHFAVVTADRIRMRPLPALAARE
jgi:predicted nuclease of predicted toxin-antitoxin system